MCVVVFVCPSCYVLVSVTSEKSYKSLLSVFHILGKLHTHLKAFSDLQESQAP